MSRIESMRPGLLGGLNHAIRRRQTCHHAIALSGYEAVDAVLPDLFPGFTAIAGAPNFAARCSKNHGWITVRVDNIAGLVDRPVTIVARGHVGMILCREHSRTGQSKERTILAGEQYPAVGLWCFDNSLNGKRVDTTRPRVPGWPGGIIRRCHIPDADPVAEPEFAGDFENQIRHLPWSDSPGSCRQAKADQ